MTKEEGGAGFTGNNSYIAMRRRHGGDKPRSFDMLFSCLGACAEGMRAAICALYARDGTMLGAEDGRKGHGRRGGRGWCSAACVRRSRGRSAACRRLENYCTQRKDAGPKSGHARISPRIGRRPHFVLACTAAIFTRFRRTRLPGRSRGRMQTALATAVNDEADWKEF